MMIIIIVIIYYYKIADISGSRTKEIDDVIYNPIFKANPPSMNRSYLHFTNTSVKWRLVSVCTSKEVY